MKHLNATSAVGLLTCIAMCFLDCSQTPPGAELDAGLDGGAEDRPDAGLDAGVDAGLDGSVDAGPDAGPQARVGAGRFIHLGKSFDGGTPLDAQFGSDEIAKIAQSFDVLQIAKFHANWDATAQQDDVKQIALEASRVGRSVQINLYFSSSLVFWLDDAARFRAYYGRELSQFNQAQWLLRTQPVAPQVQGNVVTYEDGIIAAFADLSNPDYRDWAVGVIRDWSRRAPYTGVFLDNSRPLGDYGPVHNPANLPLTGWRLDWTMLVGSNQVVAYNLGLNQFFDTLRGQFPHLVYNGIGRRDWMPITNPRNLDLLMHAEGAMNEGFCFDRSGTVDVLWSQEDMIADIAIMRSAPDAGKMICNRSRRSARMMCAISASDGA